MTPTSFIDEMAETYLNGLSLFSWVKDDRTLGAFNGLAQIQLHLTTIKEARRNMRPFFLQTYGSIRAKPAVITSLNSVKVTVVSGARDCDFQSIQRGGGWRNPACHSQCRHLAPAEALTVLCLDPAWMRFWEPQVNQQSEMILSVLLWQRNHGINRDTSRTVAWYTAGLHQACALRLLA